ncbi:ABC transporter permease [Nakamurella antarctica]|uniref:ABC transporter permease n=1 Tax=Nakamurella antarctica TaxID=1902245 RepID=A0A3G8ZMX0_9ACTN|nr:ABC transporter permease [Nakamurella antarctica]AZI58600.1 ABC transporter permease [Nakamurella antarctica]
MIDEISNYLSDPKTWSGKRTLPIRFLEHLQYSATALIIALLIALPLGLLIGHTGKGAGPVIAVANALRALPTLGLLFFFVVLLSSQFPGKGDTAFLIPTLIVLLLLAIPSILANTIAGIQNVDPAARDAAFGLGMTRTQVLLRVEAPNAMPLIMSGIRSATLQVIATATIAAATPLGGLGRLIFDGLARQDFGMMIVGALLVSLLAIGIDLLLAGLGRLITSRGVTGRFSTKSSAASQGLGTHDRGDDDSTLAHEMPIEVKARV